MHLMRHSIRPSLSRSAALVLSLMFAGLLLNGLVARTCTPAFAGDLQSADTSKAHDQDSPWHRFPPNQIKFPSQESAKYLPDGSLLFSLPSPNWSEPEFHFQAQKPWKIREVRLELLPDPRFSDRRLGRRNLELRLFELKPLLRPKSANPQVLEFSRCRIEQAPKDGQAVDMIDYATDTGWLVPKLKPKQNSHQIVFAFEPPVTLEPGDRLALSLDSGGSSELDTLARVRFSFSETTTHSASRVEDYQQRLFRTHKIEPIKRSKDALNRQPSGIAKANTKANRIKPAKLEGWKIHPQRSAYWVEEAESGEISEYPRGRASIDLKHNPMWLDFTWKRGDGQRMNLPCIFKLEDRKIVVAYSASKTMPPQRPKNFNAEAGKHVITLAPW